VHINVTVIKKLYGVIHWRRTSNESMHSSDEVYVAAYVRCGCVHIRGTEWFGWWTCCLALLSQIPTTFCMISFLQFSKHPKITTYATVHITDLLLNFVSLILSIDCS